MGILSSKKPTSWLVWTMTTIRTDLLQGNGFGRRSLYLKSNAFYGNVSIKAYQLKKSLLLEASTFPFVAQFATPQRNQSCTCSEIVLRFELFGIPSLLASTLIYCMVQNSWTGLKSTAHLTRLQVLALVRELFSPLEFGVYGYGGIGQFLGTIPLLNQSWQKH